MIIDGKKIASEILERLKSQSAPRKFFAAILSGDDPASVSFLKQQKEKTAQGLGIEFELYQFPADIAKEKLADEVRKIAADADCGGIIVQSPLPRREDEQYVWDAIPPEKDVDVLGARAIAAFVGDENKIIPPVAGVVEEILSALRSSLSASVVTVLGAGPLVGKPIATWLKDKIKKLIIIDFGDDISQLSRADIVICGTGQPGLVKPDMLKPNAIVIDFGYGRTPGGKLMGDFDPQLSALRSPLSASYTPTPGGTGPILVAKLFENFYKLNK